MNIKDKIKNLREMNGWSQEVMAERLNMSKNGYARIERGESKLDMERLEKIAEIFSIEVVDLISQEYERAIFVIGGDSSNNTGNKQHDLLRQRSFPRQRKREIKANHLTQGRITDTKEQ